MKALEKQIKRFAEGKYSAFGVLFDEVSQEVWSVFEEKCAENISLAQYLHTKTMAKLLQMWIAQGRLLESSETEFRKQARDQAMHEREIYQQVQDNQLNQPEYFDQLKLKLKAKLQESKKDNPNFFVYYLHYFRFYFTGACVAVGVFLLAFLFGFFSFNKTPIFFVGSPKVWVSTGTNAFGTLQEPSTATLVQTTGTELVWTSMPTQYTLTAKQIPSFSKELAVAQEHSLSFPTLKPLIKSLRLPNFQWKRLGDQSLVEFTIGTGGYRMEFDLINHALRVVYAGDRSTLSGATESTLSESTIKKNIKNQISQMGMNLDQYGELTLLSHEGQFVRGIIPRLFEGKEIYDLNDELVGIEVYYHQGENMLLSVDNYDLGQYLVSSYGVKSQEAILQSAETQGLLINAEVSDGVKRVEKGKLVYGLVDGYLLPMLTWKGGEKLYRVYLAM